MKYSKNTNWCVRLAILIFVSIFSSCKDYLDIVPDSLATIDNAFTMRSEAEKFLYTCYSYMPKDGNLEQDPALLGGDEIWAINNSPKPNFSHGVFNLALGLQSTVNPIGEGMWVNLYKGLRDCNIFLERIGSVPDLGEQERKEWIAEVKFLKAYYHFYLVRMYGPIPLIRENLSADISIADVKIARAPVDECFAYIKQLLDEAKDDLPPNVVDPAKMLGRITKPIVYALKAKVMVTAASPLFNGNTDQATLRNRDGTQLFNQQFSTVKWDSAVVACKQAIEVCHAAGHKLYKYNPSVSVFVLTEEIKTQLSLRLAFTERWNSEVIWANTQSVNNTTQRMATPNVNPLYQENPTIGYELAPPLKIADMFYTKNGVPITEDNAWNAALTPTRVGSAADQRYIRLDYETAGSNFDREPRFYADLGFDGGVWYGQGYYNDAIPSGTYFVQAKKGQLNGKSKPDYGSITGYFIKKYVHYQNVQNSGVSDYTVTAYPWPLIRLPQLYLMYAEALNEQGGPGAEVHEYINLVRERAGLKTVRESWTNYSNNPGKFESKNGMQEIIQQETMIELAFEGARFWDLRRWKRNIVEYRKPIQGWDIEQSTAAFYYRKKFIFDQRFGLKDYFFPIRDFSITTNRNLVQNIGW
ncbi:RagB/SusD family nutrient uptake outer membrane protein [Pedobacter sp. MC2016-14]|uniref:RagB/SusD family nutrient uptake outer membrane protein n=1 Tax=Pedobacter sp. MC2016-14 TaxID=2897327 RepID=UPI001E45AAF0|nr:RagB/SusD family nutrient uptake outer membrane protein [Pedobacter sp. MC2016-14]MCD0486665.1 RagB/SusD family nutrient uptake outer membrane protein [Pedobacter sp. MC2016-14]